MEKRVQRWINVLHCHSLIGRGIRLTDCAVPVIVAVLLSAAVSGCGEEPQKAVPTPGVPVRFAAGQTGSRTMYGEETVGDDGKRTMPIYWSHDDRIVIGSPHCSSAAGVQAEYRIGVETDEETGEPAATQSYASTLDASDGVGLTWGESAEANFFAIYPSRPVHSLRSDGDGMVASLHIREHQTVGFTRNGDTWVGQGFEPTDDGRMASNPDAIMFAQSRATTADGRVPLQFKPFSTVFRVEIDGYELPADTSGLAIRSIVLEAPEGTTIAGDFTARFDASCAAMPTVEAAASASRSVEVECTADGGRSYLVVKPGERMSFNIFVIPREGLTVDGTWTMRVRTVAGDFSRQLDMNNGVVAPSMIHPMRFPALPVTTTFVPDGKTWGADLPDATPLAWLSIPGAWRYYDPVYTDNFYNPSQFDIKAHRTRLWNAGIRAFHIDVRYLNINQKSSRYTCAESICQLTDGNYYTIETDVIDELKALDALVTDSDFAICYLTLKMEAYSNKKKETLGGFDISLSFEHLKRNLNIDNLPHLFQKPLTPQTELRELRGHLAVVILVNTNLEYMIANNYQDSFPQATIAEANYEDGLVHTTDIRFGTDKIGNATMNYTLGELTSYNNKSLRLISISKRKQSVNTVLSDAGTAWESGRRDCLHLSSFGGSLAESDNPYEKAYKLYFYGLESAYSDFLNSGYNHPTGTIFLNFITRHPNLPEEPLLTEDVVNHILRTNATLRLNR